MRLFNPTYMKFNAYKIDNLKIATYESDGRENPVVFVHANSIGAASFYKQMMSDEGKKTRYISIDMPGHGASDFSLKPNLIYNIDYISEIFSSTIDALDLESCVLCGHSLGGHVALRIAQKNKKVKSLMLMGTSPLESYQDWGKSYAISETFNYFNKKNLTQEDIARLAQLFVSEDDAADISFVDNIKNTDSNFRKFMAMSYENDKTNDFEILKSLNIPIAMVYGDKDRIVDVEKLKSTGIEDYLWRKKIQIISESGHSPMWEKPKMLQYLVDVFSKDV